MNVPPTILGNTADGAGPLLHKGVSCPLEPSLPALPPLKLTNLPFYPRNLPCPPQPFNHSTLKETRTINPPVLLPSDHQPPLQEVFMCPPKNTCSVFFTFRLSLFLLNHLLNCSSPQNFFKKKKMINMFYDVCIGHT